MRSILDFIYKCRAFFVFLLLDIVALILVASYNGLQRTIFLTSCNALVGELYSMRSGITSYFGLASVNKDLADENTVLKNKLYQLESQLAFYQQDTSYKGRKDVSIEKKYSFVTAKVIYATTRKQKNYLTIDKGSADSIKPNMGVVNQRGVVGIVSTVSKHFSVVLPILHSRSKISAKVKGKSQTGSLEWEGGDPRIAMLREVPRYVVAQVGDTVVTNGYSSIFPEGIDIGTISEIRKDNDNFYYIEVSLFPEFDNLSYVDVISYKNAEEERELENKNISMEE